MSETPPETEGQQLSEDEIRKAIEAELKQVTAEQVAVQSLATFLNVAGIRLGLSPDTEGDRDLDQANTAIQAATGLLAVLEGKGLPQHAEFQGALSNLQLAYAKLSGMDEGQAAQSTGSEGSDATAQQAQPAQSGQPPKPDGSGDRGGLWVPPGS